jgi:hypothetical protein
MATVADMWAKRNTYTRGASDRCNTLCLSGLAVVWIFRTPSPNGSALTPLLLWVAGLIVVSLLLDLVQYLVGAWRTGTIARQREQELIAAGKPPDEPVAYPENHPKPMNAIFWAKIAFVGAAWVLLIVHVWRAAITATLPSLA